MIIVHEFRGRQHRWDFRHLDWTNKCGVTLGGQSSILWGACGTQIWRHTKVITYEIDGDGDVVNDNATDVAATDDDDDDDDDEQNNK